MTLDEAREFICTAVLEVERWKGHSRNFYAPDGVVYTNDKTENGIFKISTAYKNNEFDDKVKKVIEIIKKYKEDER